MVVWAISSIVIKDSDKEFWLREDAPGFHSVWVEVD